ncbi:HIT domain-containing protein [Candidatus Woesearchaeota archaeon]|nr:hypothetical protein [uncultured archaeon]MBS3123794.1 HIT domain-containing protein [Candidatus Woesearchaeota archaeon]
MPDSLKDLTPEQQKELQEKLKNMSPEQILQLQKQQCIFCQIAASKIPAKKLYEDELILVLLDINPAAKGHLLLLPKEHYSIMPQIPPETLNRLFAQAKLKSKLLLKSLKAEGTTLLAANGQAAGQRVPHFLLHLLPRKEGDGLLAAKEQLMPHENQDKLLTILKEQFAALSGAKKPVIKSDAFPDHTEESIASVAPVKKKTLRKSKTDSGAKSETKSETKQKKSEIGAKAKETETKTETKTSESTNTPSNESVSLDDIANLFK